MPELIEPHTGREFATGMPALVALGLVNSWGADLGGRRRDIEEARTVLIKGHKDLPNAKLEENGTTASDLLKQVIDLRKFIAAKAGDGGTTFFK